MSEKIIDFMKTARALAFLDTCFQSRHRLVVDADPWNHGPSKVSFRCITCGDGPRDLTTFEVKLIEG